MDGFQEVAQTPRPVAVRAGRSRDIIDFRSERGRHETLLGREDVLAELDRLLLGGPSRGWVLVKGGPGLGKSALLAEWLKRHETVAELDSLLLSGPSRRWVLVKGGPGLGRSSLLAEWLKRREAVGVSVPHHFLRRGMEDWDRPEVVKRNLAAQVEALYPQQADPDARLESRLRMLLQRVSEEVLVPCNKSLVLLVDGLDEAEVEADDSNPLPRFLPHVLPPGVKVLCASRPTYPYLNWLESQQGVQTVDLDDERWADSNQEGVRQYWKQEALRFEPPLTPDFVDEVARGASGNMLYSVMLKDWLRGQPVEKRRAELLPRGLEALLEEFWDGILRVPKALRGAVIEGLGAVAVAREALPRPLLATVAGWTEWDEGEQFLRSARPFLLEEPGGAGREKAWMPFHGSFRSFLLRKLGESREDWEREEHRRLAKVLCQWPVEASVPGFRRSYALRHGVTHWLKAGEWEQARRLYTDLGYLEAKCQVVGVPAVEEDLRSAAERECGNDPGCPRALQRAIQAESHWLRKDPKVLPLLVYNRLRGSGWTAERIERTLRFPEGLPALRLRHSVKAGRNERTLEGHTGPVNGCAVTPDGRRVVSASTDGTLRVWEVETGRVVATLQGHEGPVNGCAVTPDGRYVVSASEDGTLKVWEVETERLATLKGHTRGVTGCAVTPDGRHVVSASADETLKVWELETGREVATLQGEKNGDPEKRGHGNVVTGCAVTPDGRHVVSASADETLKVWEWETRREVATLRGHRNAVSGCAVTPDGRHVVSASWDKTLKVWEWETGRELDTLEGHSRPVMGCAVTPDGRRVVSASSDWTLKVWEWEAGRERLTAVGHTDSVRSCALTADGRRVVSASDDETLKVWEVETGRELTTLVGHTDPVSGCAVTADGRHVVSVSWDDTLKVWEWETGQPLATWEEHGGGVNGCAVTVDGRHVVSASSDGTLKVREVEGGREVVTLKGHKGEVKGCAVTPDGQRVVSASEDKTLKVWELETGRELATLEGHGGSVMGCAVTPDGQRVVSASYDSMLKVWEVESGRELATLKGHGGPVLGCAVTPDGGRVVSVSQDFTLKVWDLDSGGCLHTLPGAGAFAAVAASAEVLCAGDELGNVWILEAPGRQVAERESTRESVFISYSEEDERWLERLRTHLAPFVRSGAFELWDNTRIQAGAERRTELENALARARVAVLLVSADFLASDLIHQQELQPLLRAAEHEGLKILWVPLSASGVQSTELARYQPVLDPEKPLNGLTRAQAEEALETVREEILRALK